MEAAALLETKEKTRDGEDGGEEERRNVLAHLHNAVSMQDLDESGTWRYGAAGLIVLYFVVGMVYYTQFSVPDNFRAIDALYFCVVTITTVGYGDTNTEYDEDGSDRDMIFTSFFVLLGVGLVGAALGVVLAYVLDKEDELAASLAEDELDEAERARETTEVFLGLRLRPAHAKVMLSTVVIFGLLLLGMVSFKYLENTSFCEAFYWTAVSITTVGYGDVYPTTDAGKLFACAFLLIGCVLMAKALADIAALPLEIRRERLEQQVLEQYGEDLDPDEFQEILQSFVKLGLTLRHEGSCTQAEFILSMLLKIDKVNLRDVKRCLTIFKSLDYDKSGTLDYGDIKGSHSLEYSSPAESSS